MSRPTTRTPVAIFNSRAEFIDGLREALDREGLPTATALLAEIQDGTLDLVAFLEAHDPGVIVYDLPRPFERHWKHRANILRAGFQYHIEKPVTSEKLAGIVALLALKAHSPQEG